MQSPCAVSSFSTLEAVVAVIVIGSLRGTFIRSANIQVRNEAAVELFKAKSPSSFQGWGCWPMILDTKVHKHKQDTRYRKQYGKSVVSQCAEGGQTCGNKDAACQRFHRSVIEILTTTSPWQRIKRKKIGK